MEVLEISIKVEMTDARADLEAKIALCHRLMLGVTDQRMFFELTVYLRELAAGSQCRRLLRGTSDRKSYERLSAYARRLDRGAGRLQPAAANSNSSIPTRR